MLMDKPDLANGAAAGFAVPNPLQPVQPLPPQDWQTGLPDAASPLMVQLADLNRLFLFVALGVFALVVLLIGWALIRYHHRWHPVARTVRENPLMQAAWIGIPAIMLVLMAIPALKLIAAAAAGPQPDLTIAVIGKTGGWTYDYLEDGDFRFDSQLLDAQTAKKYQQPYVFAADAPLVVPVGKVIALRITSADMIHSWVAPALGLHIDAVPGRINTVWFKPMREGIYYGLCSEFCGSRHGGMPIAVKVVSDVEYRGWLSWAYQRYNDAATPATLPGSGH
ncbi:MAG: cytochrome c oxidase subunit II transmembrane domain-containing protein [Rhizomicrobium sp.]